MAETKPITVIFKENCEFNIIWLGNKKIDLFKSRKYDLSEDELKLIDSSLYDEVNEEKAKQPVDPKPNPSSGSMQSGGVTTGQRQPPQVAPNAGNITVNK